MLDHLIKHGQFLPVVVALLIAGVDDVRNDFQVLLNLLETWFFHDRFQIHFDNWMVEQYFRVRKGMESNCRTEK